MPFTQQPTAVGQSVDRQSKNKDAVNHLIVALTHTSSTRIINLVTMLLKDYNHSTGFDFKRLHLSPCLRFMHFKFDIKAIHLPNYKPSTTHT